MNEHKDLSAQKHTPKHSKWRIVGNAEVSKSGKSLRIWIGSNFSLQYYYLGIEDLKGLLSGQKKMVRVYIPEENLGR